MIIEYHFIKETGITKQIQQDKRPGWKTNLRKYCKGANLSICQQYLKFPKYKKGVARSAAIF